MENANFSHFATSKEDTNHLKQAKVDGYHFGDRLMEGVYFVITINDDGTLSATVDPRHAGYFEQFNAELWYNKAIDHALGNDIFVPAEGPTNVHNLYLIKNDGKYNWEKEEQSKGIKIQKSNLGGIAMAISKHPFQK